MDGVYDGFVSRHLNRRLSRPAARLLGHTPVTPNQVSVASLGVALGSFLCFAYGYPIAAALLAQTSSVLDGVDGDLARLKGLTSAFGGFMDAVIDRYTDALIILGLTLWAAGDESSVTVWMTGFLALAGTFAVTYSRARVEGLPRNVFDRGITSLASRDIRLLLIMVGALAGQGFSTLLVLASLTNAVALMRLVQARRLLGGTTAKERVS
jgi:CDP-L-myo-inositol myo-inositolphosphotransferase